MRFRVAGVGLPSRATLGLAILAAAPPLVAWLIAAAVELPDRFNDFHSYWYAGRLLAEGASPYDLEALRDLAARYGADFVVGTGYSYPLPFALAVQPLSVLPFDAALVVFNGLSIAVFAAAVAAWLRRFHAAAPPVRVRVVALACGAWPPVIGSVVNGQANLVVLAAVAAGAALALEPSRARSAVGGVAIGLAAVVKLVPGVIAVPLWLAGNRRIAVAGVALGLLAPLGLATLAEPVTSLETGRLAALFRPDPFVTNQSVNGFVSRLVEGSDRMTALAPGAFDPAPLSAALTLGLAVATFAVLWRSRTCLASPDGLAAGIALALVAATAGAPKTSFWNAALVLVAAGLLLAWVAPGLAPSGLDRWERRLFVAWWGSAFVQPVFWTIAPLPAGPTAALVVLLGSLALYGTLALWVLLGRRLRRLARIAEARGPTGALVPGVSAPAS